MLHKRRVAFLLCTLTLALVVASTSAVLAVVDATLVRPLPFVDSHQLVRLYLQPPGTSDFAQANPFGSIMFARAREQAGSLSGIEGIWTQERAIGGEGEPESVPAARVSNGFFSLLGASPVIGRTFTADEELANARLVVLSYGLWQRRYGGDRSVLGRTLLIDREPHTVIGVMGAMFEPVYASSQFWTPLDIHSGRIILPTATFIQTVGRLAPGATVQRVGSELEPVLARAQEQAPDTWRGWRIGARPLRDAQFGAATPALSILLVAIVALSLVAGANLANVTLADLLGRRSELALKVALGASRRRLLRDELLRGSVMTGAGAVLGLVLTALALPLLLQLDTTNAIPRNAVTLDWRAATMSVALAALVIVVAIVVALARTAREDLASSSINLGARTIGSRRDARFGSWLVGVQTALVLVLLVSGAFLLAGFDRAARTDPGFDPHHLVGAQLRLTDSAYPTQDARTAFVNTVLDRVRAVPGVVSASTTLNYFIPGFVIQTLVQIEGRPTPTGDGHTVTFHRISPGYFETMRIPVFEGRTFDAHDTAASPPVAVVSRLFASRMWPGESAVGKRVQRSSTSAWITVIGVVGDVSDAGFGQAPLETLYVAYAQQNNTNAPATLVVRIAGDSAAVVAGIRGAVLAIDPAQPIGGVTTVTKFLDDSLGPQRFRTTLVTIFAAIALALALIGVYGVAARGVADRTREVGVRLALGGLPQVVWLTVARRALGAIGAGAGVGILAAVFAVRLIERLLPDVAGASLSGAAIAVAVLAATSVVAVLLPAWRATRVDPLAVLRGA
jgi:predicted permease